MIYTDKWCIRINQPRVIYIINLPDGVKLLQVTGSRDLLQPAVGVHQQRRRRLFVPHAEVARSGCMCV